MRTTIEIKPRTGRRWAKRFSALIAEALDAYLTWADADEAKHRAALKLRGALGPTQAEALATATRGVREACR